MLKSESDLPLSVGGPKLMLYFGGMIPSGSNSPPPSAFRLLRPCWGIKGIGPLPSSNPLLPPSTKLKRDVKRNGQWGTFPGDCKHFQHSLLLTRKWRRGGEEWRKWGKFAKLCKIHSDRTQSGFGRTWFTGFLDKSRTFGMRMREHYNLKFYYTEKTRGGVFLESREMIWWAWYIDIRLPCYFCFSDNNNRFTLSLLLSKRTLQVKFPNRDSDSVCPFHYLLN